MYGATMPHDPPVNEIKAELFRALAHPVRIRALELLVEHPCTVSELQAEMGIDAARVSQQLSVLRRADLVRTERSGTTVTYSIKDPLLGDLLAVARRLLIASLEARRDLLHELERSGR